MKKYTKRTVIEAEPWTPDTDMNGVSISELDKPPRPGGMVARDLRNHEDRWYINEEYFRDYEKVK